MINYERSHEIEESNFIPEDYKAPYKTVLGEIYSPFPNHTDIIPKIGQAPIPILINF